MPHKPDHEDLMKQIQYLEQENSRLRQVELKQGEKEELLRMVAENFPGGILAIYDTDFRYTFVSGMGLKDIPLSAKLLIGKKPRDIFPAEFSKKLEHCLEKALKGEQETFEISLGHQVFTETVCPLYKNEKITAILGVITNITKSRQAEQKLRLAHEKLIKILDGIDATIYVADMNTYEILFMNQKMIDAFGRDMTGMKCYQAFRNETEPCSFCTMKQLLDQTGKPTGVCVWQGRNPLTGKQYINHDQAVEWIDGRMVLLQTALDITEQTKMEQQLRQAQKMEAVGTLAGGIAHDFNNMLGVILGHSDMALKKMEPAGPLFDHLQQIRKSAERSADITRQLLAFARKQTIAPKILDLNLSMKSMLNILRRLIGENINLVWRPASGLRPVKMDPAQIDQILANLCVNARDAISGVGTIVIETAMVTLDQEYCLHHAGFTPGEFVLLAVSDDGCGMDKATLGNIFDPFFTTKDVGRGTGLGLATVYGIVKQNQGFINVYSEPCRGTTFRIYLPRQMSLTEEPVQKMPSKSMPKGHETILLVEDEPMILEMTKKMLEFQGYTVLSADRPKEALRLADGYAGKIHLLLTDVVLPEMNGRILAEQLTKLHPDLRLLFMSGYTSNAITHQGVLDEGARFIQKPYSFSDLALQIRNALE